MLISVNYGYAYVAIFILALSFYCFKPVESMPFNSNCSFISDLCILQFKSLTFIKFKLPIFVQFKLPVYI